MIKNLKTLLKTLSLPVRKKRAILLKIADFVLDRISSKNLFGDKLKRSFLRRFDKIAIIGIGKAAKGMVNALTASMQRKPDKILLADQDHPLPTPAGVAKTQKIIRLARELGPNNLAIVLISGGGSAMLTMPVPEIKLKDKIDVTKALLRAGANINELNVVRKHLSQVKGGNLAALLYPAAVLGFVISDVVGNDLSTISSGPLSPDPTTFFDALKILKKYKISANKRIMDYLKKGLKNSALETPKQRSKYFKRVKIKILADHTTLLKMAAKKAKTMDIKTILGKKLITGEAREAAKILLKKARKGACAIFAGETTVTCCGNGAGGRNQELVLSALRHLKPDQTIISIGTDGVDGICPEPIAGAAADIETIKTAKKLKLNITDYLRRNDSYGFFKKTNGLIKTGPTGTNLGDLILILS